MHWCVVSPCAGVVHGCVRASLASPPLLALWPSQVLLGAFDSEAEAAHAYDLVVLTVEGPRAAVTNVSSNEHLSTPVLRDFSMLKSSVPPPKHAAGPDTLLHCLVCYVVCSMMQASVVALGWASCWPQACTPCCAASATTSRPWHGELSMAPTVQCTRVMVGAVHGDVHTTDTPSASCLQLCANLARRVPLDGPGGALGGSAVPREGLQGQSGTAA